MADVASCQSSIVHIFRGTLAYDCKVVTKFGGDINSTPPPTFFHAAFLSLP